jgi:hypothetical protein
MLYKTLNRTVLTYGSETWTLSKNSESTLERKILRIIYDPVQDNGQWRIRYKELCELCGEPVLVTCIKPERLQWAGHVQRMEGTRIPKKVFKAKFEGVRSVGEPRKRWEDAVRRNAASFLRCRNWKLAANDIALWRQKTEEAKARFGLERHWMDGRSYRSHCYHHHVAAVVLLGIPKQYSISCVDTVVI